MATSKRVDLKDEVDKNQELNTVSRADVARSTKKVDPDVNLEISGEVNDTALQYGQSGKTVDNPPVAVEEYEAGKRQFEARQSGEFEQNKANVAMARAEKYGTADAETVYDRVEKTGRS